MRKSKIQLAIEAALSQNWQEAITLNKEILKENKNDLDALVRIAYAYRQNTEIDKAKKTYKKILSIDKYNNIAHKNLEKLNTTKSSKNPCNDEKFKITPGLFLEETGRTKTVQLTNIAPSTVLNKLQIGETVQLIPKKYSIEVRNFKKVYYGALPDDISFRLLSCIKAGNKYQACIKNVQKNSVTVFIKEEIRGKKMRNQATFITTNPRDYTASYVKQMRKKISFEEQMQKDQDEE